MTVEQIDELYDEYEDTFGEKPLVMYPTSVYSPVYVHLMKKALEKGVPYTEEDLNKALKLEEEDDI